MNLNRFNSSLYLFSSSYGRVLIAKLEEKLAAAEQTISQANEISESLKDKLEDTLRRHLGLENDKSQNEKEIKRLNDIADRFRYKPTKAKMALSKLKQIERMVKVEEPNKYDLKTFKTNFILNKETGNFILRAEDLEIGYNSKIASINFELYKGQKLGIIGGNGTGKTTLLKTIMKMPNG